MIFDFIRKIRIAGFVAAAVSCVTVGGLTVSSALAAGPNVTFTAAGTFASPPISGNDSLLLAGQPFTISIVANAAATPSQHGRNWALFVPLSLTGSITSGLIGSAVPISSTQAAIFQAAGASADIFKSGFPIVVVGINLTARAEITLPGGTLNNALIHPFASVALDSSNATVTYSNGSLSTTLAIETGTLVATIPGPAAAVSPAGVALHAAGARVVTWQPDGTPATRPLGAGPVTLTSGSRAMLKFYASGVPDGAVAHVRIGGEEAPVLYAGKSGSNSGVSEVHVLVPASLAGSGNADVVLEVNGQMSKPIHVQIE